MPQKGKSTFDKTHFKAALLRGLLFQDRGNHLRRALLINQPDGPDPFKHTQHPLTTRGESMYRMEKITTGAAYGASAGSILNGMLNAYSPDQ